MLTVAFIAALLYLALCAALFVFQRSLLYFPQPRAAGSAAPTLRLPVDGAEVVVTTRPGPGPEAVVYFGGDAEDVTGSLPELAAAFPDQSLYLLHYRGFGGSTGSPSESSLVSDGLALFDRVRSQHAHITLVGRSLGSGVAVQVAGQRAAARLVLVTPYDSILAIASQQFPYVPVRWLLLDRFESWKHAQRIHTPTLLIAAEDDEVIPLAHTQSLLARFPPGTARMAVVPRTSHNSISASPAYPALLKGSP